MRFLHYSLNFLVLILVAGSCAPPRATNAAERAPAAPSEPGISVKRVTERPANPDGGVIIVEYHKIAKEEARWDRSIVRFKQDLLRFYKLDFRPVLLSSYLSGKFDLPPGASPVIFTFDDSHPSQIRFLDDGSLDPDCALGIWQSFAKEHPGFPVRASFFILPPTGPWGQPSLVERKFDLLQELGCEVGSHTVDHPNLGKTPASQAEAQLRDANRFIERAGFEPFAIALPFGVSPKDPKLIAKYHKIALLVGAGPAPPPGSPKLNLLRLPRIQGIDGDFGITYWLDRVESGEFRPYVQP
jgi:hypothetical protein